MPLKNTICKSIGMSFFLLFCLCCQVFGAPAVNMDDPIIWNPKGFRMKSDIGWVISLDYDFQKNDFLTQRKRFPYIFPNDAAQEERHKEISRSSQMELSYQGVKVGAVLKNKYFLYTIFGTSDTRLQFQYLNETRVSSLSGNDYYRDNEYTSYGDIVYGAGISTILFEPELEDVDLFKIGFDFKYRHLSIDSYRKDQPNITYTSDLDEMQFALIIAREVLNMYPYFGARITRMDGKENYRDILAAATYEDPVIYDEYIRPSENIGFLIGSHFKLFDVVSLGIEYRFGEEVGYGVNASFRY